MPNILVVEDDENLNCGITFSLKKSGYEVFSAESVKKAKRIASDNNVDVAICDVNLPDGNGLELVRWMRNCQNVYIICLTALDQETDQVMGYEAGADDYMTKPFSLSVLLLKIEAHFRRRQEKTEAGKMISGDIVFIAGEMKVLIKSREISLTKTELKRPPAGKTVKLKFLGTGMISVMPVPLLEAHPRECSPQGRTRYVPSACACRWTCQVHLHRPP